MILDSIAVFVKVDHSVYRFPMGRTHKSIVPCQHRESVAIGPECTLYPRDSLAEPCADWKRTWKLGSRSYGRDVLGLGFGMWAK